MKTKTLQADVTINISNWWGTKQVRIGLFDSAQNSSALAIPAINALCVTPHPIDRIKWVID
jgi:hypothetical protein